MPGKTILARMKLNPMSITLLSIAVIIVSSVFWFASVTNHVVQLQADVDAQWAQVENVYQRRSDLIPNLVSTVKGYATHEDQVFENVARARAQVGQVKASDPASLKAYDDAQSQVTGALSRLLVVSENYPQLKADRGFLELQSELEGTENRIAVERKRFNDMARDYNIYIKSFPQSFIAHNAQPKPYFTADKEAQAAPKVQF